MRDVQRKARCIEQDNYLQAVKIGGNKENKEQRFDNKSNKDRLYKTFLQLLDEFPQGQASNNTHFIEIMSKSRKIWKAIKEILIGHKLVELRVQELMDA